MDVSFGLKLRGEGERLIERMRERDSESGGRGEAGREIERGR